MQIDFPVGDLGGFSCAEAEVRFSYKYKNLRTALSNIPQKDATGVNSKVRLSAPFTRWLIYPFSVCLCMHPSIHAPQSHTHLSIRPFIHPSTHSLTHSLSCSVIHSHTHIHVHLSYRLL